jgi:hypothetical protein
MRKIYYINELGYPDGCHIFDVHRLPQAYMHYLNWHSLSYDSIQNLNLEVDCILIFQTPCNDELRKLSIIKQYIDRYTCCITQEGSIFDWFDWPAAEQELYIELLSQCSSFLYHSEHDKKVMQLFCTKFVKYPGCINLTIDQPKLFTQGQYVLIPAPIKRYQRGMISHKLITGHVDLQIYSMSYNAPKNIALSFPDSYKLDSIKMLNRMDNKNWLECIYSSKFGIDIHRDFSGGNVALEFGSLATPLIGNIELDIQRDIFPDISFEYNDYENIRKAINMLMRDKDFYDEVSKKALHNTITKYNSNLIVSNFDTELKNLL